VRIEKRDETKLRVNREANNENPRTRRRVNWEIWP
jgi:hypothetical protein